MEKEKQSPENKERRKVEKRRLFAVVSLLAIIIILLIFLYANFLDTFSLFEVKEVEANVVVSGGVGVAVNGTALVFGMVMPGGSSLKQVNLTNTYGGLARVKIYAKGNIKDFLNVSDNNFILAPNESRQLSFRVKIPKDTPYGNYSGRVVFEIRNAIVK